MLSWRHEIPRVRASPRQYPALRRDGDATRPLASWRRALPALAALGLAACASGGASGGDPTLRIWPLADRGAEAIGSWRSELLSGAGSDWARKALCRPDGGCTFFGNTRGSFGLGPGTAFIAVGEIPDLRPQWARTYGGGGTDELDGAVATPDGGFVMFGSSDSRYTAGAGGAAPAPRPLVIRAAAEGEPRWVRALEGGGIHRFHGAAVEGGALVLVGYAAMSADTPGPAVVRLSEEGALQWAETLDLGGGGYAVAVVGTGEGGVIVAGYLRSGNVAFAGASFLVRLDAAGRPLWARRYETEVPAQPRALLRDAGGELVLVGTLFDPRGGRSPFLLRVGGDGTLRAAREYRGLEANEVHAAAEAGGGRIVMTGRQRDPFVNRQRGLALLIDPGNRIRAYGTMSAQGSVELTSVATAREGEYRLVGHTDSFGAAGLDILAASWLPAARGGTDELAPGIAERELTVRTSPVEPRRVALPVEAREIPLDALVVTPLRVPGGAGGR